MSTLCSRAHFCLRNNSKIRHLLDWRTAAILVHVCVTSRLENGNALLFGLPGQAATGEEFSRSPGVPDWSTRPHHPGLIQTALAAGQTEGGLQASAAHLQGTTWLGTSVPGGPSVLILAHTINAVQRLTAILSVPCSRLRTFGDMQNFCQCGAATVEHPASCYPCFCHLEHF